MAGAAPAYVMFELAINSREVDAAVMNCPVPRTPVKYGLELAKICTVAPVSCVFDICPIPLTERFPLMLPFSQYDFTVPAYTSNTAPVTLRLEMLYGPLMMSWNDPTFTEEPLPLMVMDFPPGEMRLPLGV